MNIPSVGRFKVTTVTSRVDQRDHLEYEELLPAAAFNSLTADERNLLQEHLATCATCPRALAELKAIASALPATLDEMEPPSNLRERIAQAIDEQDTPPAQAPPSSDARWVPAAAAGQPDVGGTVSTAPTPIRPPQSNAPTRFRPAFLVATAAMLVVALVAGTVIGRVFLADSDNGGNPVETFALTFSDPEYSEASGDVRYLAEDGVFVVSTANVPPVDSDHVYQVWLINDAGPKPVGVMDNPDGTFSVAANRDEFQTLAMTVEPGPLGSTGPTTTPFVTASLVPTGS